MRRFVQISAAGASEDAPTAFFRTKARGDAALRESRLDWVILRPGLVIGPDAYGGTALLRGLAALPLVQPLVHADAPLQTVALADVARAACRAAIGGIPPGTEVDLVAAEPLPLRAVVARFRAWLGFAPAWRTVELPSGAARLAARVADGLGWLGWRSPLRTTALAAIAGGVRGDPRPWRALTGEDLAGLGETLAAMPATVQERRFARLYFMMPVAVAALALVWLPGGAMAIAGPAGPAWAGAAGIGLGLAVLVRRWARAACLGMVALGLAWSALGLPSPPAGGLGLLPSVVLAIATAAMLGER